MVHKTRNAFCQRVLGVSMRKMPSGMFEIIPGWHNDKGDSYPVLAKAMVFFVRVFTLLGNSHPEFEKRPSNRDPQGAKRYTKDTCCD